MIQTDLCCCRKVMYLNALGSLLDENTIRAVDGKGEEVGFCFSCNELRETCMVRHVTHDDSLSKTILQGTLEDGRHSSQQRKPWMDNMEEWTPLSMPELLTMVS